MNAEYRYSAEEIRFNLLAVGPRLLPLFHQQLAQLTQLLTDVTSQLDDLIPDWKVFDEHPALDCPATQDLLTSTLQKGDPAELMALKKAVDRDLALLKRKVSDEEDKISEYMVRHVLRC
jgi:hypothetical protein